MKKLLQIGIEVNSGSTGRIAEQIGAIALENGWESYITYARGYNPSQSKTIKIGNQWNIFLHVLKTRFLGNHLKASTKATKKLIRQIEIIKPDIIQLHQLHGYFLNIEILFTFLKQQKIPIVWTLHDCWAFTGHCAYYSLINCNKWQTECFNCPQIHKYPKSFIDRSNQNYHLKRNLFTNIPNFHLVTVSQWLNKELDKSFLKNYPKLTIQNGVDTQKFTPQLNIHRIREKYKIPQNPVVMALGTTWNASKGLYDYFELRKILDEKISIVLIGLTKKHLKNLPKGIIGIERTESIAELAELYSLADIVLHLSYQESFGLPPIEAFACGTPVIVYNNTALPELVSIDVGKIVETGNVHSVRNAILEILSNGKSHYSQHCRKKAVDEFDVRIKYNQYLSLYERLLS